MRFLAAIFVCLILVPAEAMETCTASVYSTQDHDQNGTKTASGIPLNDAIPSIAHKTLPLKSRAWVVNLKTGQGYSFLVTDRGPYIAGRCVDLSVKAARLIGCDGLCSVEVR